MKKFLVQLLILLCGLFFIACESKVVKNSKANEVVITASEVQYDNTVQLNGNWNFYFQNYLTIAQQLVGKKKRKYSDSGMLAW